MTWKFIVIMNTREKLAPVHFQKKKKQSQGIITVSSSHSQPEANLWLGDPSLSDRNTPQFEVVQRLRALCDPFLALFAIYITLGKSLNSLCSSVYKNFQSFWLKMLLKVPGTIPEINEKSSKRRLALNHPSLVYPPLSLLSQHQAGT